MSREVSWSARGCASRVSSEMFPHRRDNGGFNSCPTIAHLFLLFLSTTINLKLSSLKLMSHPRSTAMSSSNFQITIINALKVYQKRTKNELLLHPLAGQLQACTSSSDILAVLRQQVQGLDQSRSGDDRWTKWLGPAINVLLTLSQSAGTVGLVCSTTR